MTFDEEKIADSFEFAVEEGDIATFPSDVIILKYAQYFYGADRQVAEILGKRGISKDSLRPLPNKYCYVESTGLLAADLRCF